MKHYLCEEMVTGEMFLVSANNLLEAYRIAEPIGADFSCGCEREPEIYIQPEPLTDDEAEATGLDEY